MMQKKFLINLFVLLLWSNVLPAQSRIYLIRHAKVDLKSPKCSSTKGVQKHKDLYNIAPVVPFEANVVLDKIEHWETIDTIFCSPQKRALETAEYIFHDLVGLTVDSNLMEFNYKVMQLPIVRFPTRIWQAISLITWMAGNNKKGIPSYRKRKRDLKAYSDKIISFSERNGITVIVGHGVMNRELIKILKKKGWKYQKRAGSKNLSVNCLVKKD